MFSSILGYLSCCLQTDSASQSKKKDTTCAALKKTTRLRIVYGGSPCIRWCDCRACKPLLHPITQAPRMLLERSISIKKNVVAATMEIEMIQKEMATGSFGLRNPCKSCVMMRRLLVCKRSREKENRHPVRLEPRNNATFFGTRFCSRMMETDFNVGLQRIQRTTIVTTSAHK